MLDNRREVHMKQPKEFGVKAKVVVTFSEQADDNTIVLYRGRKTGLAFRSPSHRVLKIAARQRNRGEAAASGAQASAAVTHQQGGLR